MIRGFGWYFSLVCVISLGMAAGRAPAATPDPLRCAAIYGVIASGDASPRSDSARAARDQIIAGQGVAPVQPYDDAAAADKAAGRLNADEMAGTCDRLYRYAVAETSSQPYHPAKSHTLSDLLKAPPTSTTESAPSPAPSSGTGFLLATCNGSSQAFDSGLSRDGLTQAAHDRGCTASDIDAMLMAHDLLYGN